MLALLLRLIAQARNPQVQHMLAYAAAHLDCPHPVTVWLTRARRLWLVYAPLALALLLNVAPFVPSGDYVTYVNGGIAVLVALGVTPARPKELEAHPDEDSEFYPPSE